MQTCKTCKYWQIQEKDRWNELITPLDPDTYEQMKMPFEVRWCCNPKLGFFERPVEVDAAALVDGSEYHAALLTAEGFGCANYMESGANVTSVG